MKELVDATKERDLYLVREFCKDYPSWSDINDLYDLTKNTGKEKEIDFNSFGTVMIENSNNVISYYKNAIESISLMHKGNLQFGMMIIHLINRNNNIVKGFHALRFKDKFYADNPKKIPKELTIKDYGVDGWPIENWDPTVHSDPQDRFFIQGDGESLWKIFDDGSVLVKEYTLKPGDMAYIPRGVIHSVESLCPRYAVSIAFGDDPRIAMYAPMVNSLL
jgi:mannose-6-phosphate isomerase-like protein (cupin superfamily)